MAAADPAPAARYTNPLASYQPPPVEQARSITFSRMVRTIEPMMLSMHPLLRTCIAMRGSFSDLWIQDREPIPPGSNHALTTAATAEWTPS
jgi:hypothetical protein